MATLSRRDAPPDETLAVTLATGCPALKGIVIRPNHPDVDVVTNITIKANSETVTNWKPELFKYYVATKVRNLVPGQFFDIAELYGIWYQASLGKKIVNVPIHNIPKPDQRDMRFCRKGLFRVRNRGLLLLSNRTLSGVVVNPETDRSRQSGSGKRIWQRAVYSANGRRYEKDQTQPQGVERFGLDLPVIMVLAIKETKKYQN